jgi:hypothetical protein
MGRRKQRHAPYKHDHIRVNKNSGHSNVDAMIQEVTFPFVDKQGNSLFERKIRGRGR